jgi:hypothetical protein
VWARISRPVRIVLAVLGGVLLVGTAIAIPFIASGKKKGAAEERRSDAAAKARAEARLRIDQMPHRGRAPGAPSRPAAARRAAIVTALEGAITADAQARFRTGHLAGPIVKATRCDFANKQLADLQPDARRHGGAVLDCLAATSLSTRPGGTRFAIGYEFIAAANWRRGTFTWCKTNPPPGEKFGGARRAEVPLKQACIDPAG